MFELGKENFPDTYITGQYYRGKYLLGLVIYVWAGNFFLCLVSCIAMCIHGKKHS